MFAPRFSARTLCAVATCCGTLSSLFAAEFRLGSPLSDHMVLQREKSVAVWGWADPDEPVSVSFAGQSKSAKADTEGKWALRLDPLSASAEPKTLTVSGKENRRVEVKDVLVGEVWLGSGQSNMAMTVAGCYRFEEEKAAAQFQPIRHSRETWAPPNSRKPKARAPGRSALPPTSEASQQCSSGKG